MAPLPPQLPPAGQPNGPRTADGRPVELALGKELGRSIVEILKPGEILTARVAERFSNGSYLFTLRGRQFIAESRVALARDSTAQFQVLQTADGLHLRLLDDRAGAQLQTSDLQTRLSQLRLQDGPTSRLAIQVFQQVGAPLEGDRLRSAIAQATAQTEAVQPTTLRAHALLAKADLPASPLLLGIARETITGQPQNLANNLTELRQAVAQLPPAAFRAAGPAPANGTPALPGVPSQPAVSHPGPAMTGNATMPGMPAAAPSPSQATDVAARPTNASTDRPVNANVMQANPQQSVTSGAAAAALLPEIPDLARQDATTATRQALGSAGAVAIPMPTRDMPVPADPLAATAPSPPAATGAVVSLVEQLAHLARSLEPTHPAAQQILESVHQLGREQLGDLLLPPTTLEDYDLVVPLALANDGHPTPARLAISRRPGRPGHGDEAIFVRIDVELSHLGPLSIRLSGLGDGLLNVLLLATRRGIDPLNEGLADLEADLAEQGIEARIRIEDMLEQSDG